MGRKASLIFNVPNVNFFVFYGVIPNKKIANYNINYFGGGACFIKPMSHRVAVMKL